MKTKDIGMMFSTEEGFSDAAFWGVGVREESPVKHLPGQHDQKDHGNWARGITKYEVGKGRLSNKGEIGSAIKAYDYIAQGDVIAGMYGSGTVGFENTSRGKAKDRIATHISEETGIEYDIVNEFIAKWAYSSNDNDYQSLLTQKVASEMFEGAELSEWQKGMLESIEEKRAIQKKRVDLAEVVREADLKYDAAKQARHEGAIEIADLEGLTDYDEAYNHPDVLELTARVDAAYAEKVKVRKEYFDHEYSLEGGDLEEKHYSLFEVSVFEMYRLRTANWETDQMALDMLQSIKGKYSSNEEATHAILDSMYNWTQEELKSAGVDNIFVFRGVKLSPERAEQNGLGLVDEFGTFRFYNYVEGSTIDLTENAIESWSVRRDVGEDFTETHGEERPSMLLSMSVPRNKVLATCRTGFGCLEEWECIIINGPEDETKVEKVVG